MSRKPREPEAVCRQLLDLIHKTGQALEFQEALDALLVDARALVPCDGAAVIWLRNGRLRVEKSWGPTASLVGLTLPASQMGAAQLMLDSGREVLIGDTEEDDRWQRVSSRVTAGCWLGVPLVEGGRVIGLLEWTARQVACFGPEDVQILVEVARQIAPILYRIELLDNARHDLREAARQQSVAQAPGEHLALLLQPLVEEAREFTAARHAFVFKTDESEEQMVCVAACGERQEHLKRTLLRGDGTFGGWSLHGGDLQTRRQAGRTDRDELAALGISDPLIVPLRIHGQLAGMLGVAGPLRRRTFGQDSLGIMGHLASQASIILERTQQARPKKQAYDYEAVMQSSPLGIAVVNALGEIQAWNPALATVLAHSGPGLAGRRLSEFLDRHDGLRLDRELEEIAILGQRRALDARLVPSAGVRRYMRISLALASASENGEASIVAILEDHTSLRILERERAEYLKELKTQHDRLKDLDRLRSDFVSNVSHELRTPLAVIKLYAELARKGNPEKRAGYLQTIEQETQRLEAMVENILDITRIDRRRLKIAPEPLAAAEVVSKVLAVYGETASRKDVELKNHVREGLPPLWADRNHLIQMLTNLVDNALKYTLRGGRIWVAARVNGGQAPEMLEIAVCDSGAGIPNDELDRIFERFYRGSNNRPGLTGTGLGLAIVQELMERHGGQVTVQSRVGEGSVFTLRFPLSARDEGEQP